MDNLQSTGVSNSDEIFGFVPPNLMYGINKDDNSEFSSKEEKERYNYELDHDFHHFNLL